MESDKALVVFEDKKIRRIWHNGEWWFCINDIVTILIDTVNASDYIKKLKIRDDELNKGWGQIVTPLSIETSGGVQKLNCTSTKGAFRVIQSIPSKKAEPFKQWLAEVGYERIQEIENPELAQDRAKAYYEQKGYPKSWIDKRLRGIAVRQDLTDEWKNRGVEHKNQFSILTNEISKATFGLDIKEHKKVKGLDPKFKNRNLRDHMTDLELIFNMLGEASTTEIAKENDFQGFKENKIAAKEGGKISGNARKSLEQKTKKQVVSSNNYLYLNNKKIKQHNQ